MKSPTPKTFLKSSQLAPPNALEMFALGVLGLLLSPFYILLASFHNVPGLHFRWKCLRLGLILLFRRKAATDLKTIFLILLYPLDSTRYFELDFAWKTLKTHPLNKYLDISSPRLLFTLFLLEDKSLHAELVNPDKSDLVETAGLLKAAGLATRCRLHDCIISESKFQPGSFDLISSISVVEHIPEDRQAIEKMWQLLKPGGRLLITVPCAAKTLEQYIDRDEFGLHGGAGGGYVFWQRFYDPELLVDRIFSVTGEPVRQAVFGERAPGLFQKMVERKRQNRFYPFWREPYMTGQDYRFFQRVEDLPGEGVIAMEFVK
jgi:SAM-dependent methyltransferase